MKRNFSTILIGLLTTCLAFVAGLSLGARGSPHLPADSTSGDWTSVQARLDGLAAQIRALANVRQEPSLRTAARPAETSAPDAHPTRDSADALELDAYEERLELTLQRLERAARTISESLQGHLIQPAQYEAVSVLRIPPVPPDRADLEALAREVVAHKEATRGTLPHRLQLITFQEALDEIGAPDRVSTKGGNLVYTYYLPQKHQYLELQFFQGRLIEVRWSRPLGAR